MASNIGLPVSKRDAQSEKISNLPLTSVRAASLRKLKAEARQCHTPKQFRELLERLREFIPYEKLACSWGHHTRTTIRFVFNHSFPPEFLRWYLSTGALWKSPMFGCTPHLYTVCRGEDYCTPGLTHEEAIRASEVKKTWQDEKLYVRPVKNWEGG